METSYSSYWYQIEDIPHKTSFLKAIDLEQKDQLKLASPLCNPGLYYKHLINYFSYFDKEQFHFIIFDNIINNPLNEIKKIYRFLNVDEDFILADYDKKVNQAIGTGSIAYKLKKCWGFIKLHYPSSYALIKKLRRLMREIAILNYTIEKQDKEKNKKDG